jgi:CRISPR-associated endonuclease/helicase Cas3
VHAYDTYMTAIFKRLLSWLRAVGCPVVLLSATLPAKTRLELLEAYCGTSCELDQARYPAITWASDGRVGVVPLESSDSRRIAVDWCERKAGTMAAGLAAALTTGGCVAIICNTVRRAQQVYGELKAAQIVEDADLHLFHAQYPFAWRDDIERRVLSAFGKEGRNRPGKAIVVATQVIEQSLDLDFDLMVSELAPVDLILQRLGRLHRHSRPRPVAVASPRIILLRPEEAPDMAIPSFGADAWVYERYVLLLTFLALRDRSLLRLPEDTQPLIESVYGPAPAVPQAYRAALAEALAAMNRHSDSDAFVAESKLVPSPAEPELLRQAKSLLREDSPEAHQALQALTRLSPPTVSLVCLHQAAAGLATEPEGGGLVDAALAPDDEVTAALARHTVSVSNRVPFAHFIAQEPPQVWQDHPLLRDHRLAVFRDGRCPITGGRVLRLDRELGLWLEEES